MNAFLVEVDVVYTYADLINRLSNDNYYYSVWRYDSIYEYLVNLLKALIHQKPIILLDKDFTEKELMDLGFVASEINQPEGLSSLGEISSEILVSKLLNSTSEIRLFTSGTTGIPKQVLHTVSSLTRLIRTGEAYKKNIWALAYNPTHMAGLQVIFQAVLNFNTLVNVFNQEPACISNLLLKYQVSHISATPTFYRLFIIGDPQVKYSKVVRVTLGGEKSDQVLYNKILSAFSSAKINNVYASTELGALFVSHENIFQVPSELAEYVRINEMNELEVHTVMIPNIEGDFWYATGDIVEIQTQDPLSFVFKNRKNEMINVGGYKVNPYEVEDAVRHYEGVVDVSVYGKSNSVLGNILCMDFVSDATAFNVPDLKRYLGTQLQDFKIPRIVKQVDRIHTTRTGKTKKI